MRPSRKRRGNSRYYVYFIMVLLVTGLLGTGLYLLLMNVSWFNIHQIAHSGNSVVPDSLISSVLARYEGQNLLRVRGSELRSHFKRIARIQDIDIHKGLPHKLNVKFHERQGVLWIRSADGELRPIDKDGMVLETFGGVAKEDLPIVGTYLTLSQLKAGSKLEKSYIRSVLALHNRISKEAPEFLPFISEYYFIDNTIHMVDSRYGTSIIPAQKNIAAQLKRYLFVQDNGNIARRSTVDLRFDKQVVVKEGN